MYFLSRTSMAPRKKVRKQPSIIGSDVDRRFSPSREESDSDPSSDHSTTQAPVSTGAKRARKSDTSTTASQDKGVHKGKSISFLHTLVSDLFRVSYILQVLSAVEMKKPLNKRLVKSDMIQLSTDEPWDTMKAQILAKISLLLKINAVDIADFDIKFVIPRIIAKPGMPLVSEESYAVLLQRIQKSNSIPIVTINASQHAVETEPVQDDAEKDLKKKKGRDPETLPGNIKKNAKIKELHKRWTCPQRQISCAGTYCFIEADGSHLPLSHECFDVWASAMVCALFISVITATNDPYHQLKGDDSASVDHPPNHKLFDSTTHKISPVIQRRLDLENAKQAKAAAAPTINFNIGKEILEFLGKKTDEKETVANAAGPPAYNQAGDLTLPVPHVAQGPVPRSPARIARSRYDLNCPTLLQSNRLPGIDMPLSQFCIEFEVEPETENRLLANSYAHACLLRYITIDELTKMEFLNGQIASLRDAVQRWSQEA